MKKKRGRGRPPIWKDVLRKMRWGESIPAQNKSQAMSVYCCARRMGFTVTTARLPNGSYFVTKARKPKP